MRFAVSDVPGSVTLPARSVCSIISSFLFLLITSIETSFAAGAQLCMKMS